MPSILLLSNGKARRFALCAALLFLAVQVHVQAQTGVKINEVFANNATFQSADGSVSDWVELFNTTAAAVDISNASLTDDPAKPRKWVVPAGVSIPANGFRTILLDAGRAPSLAAEPLLNAGFSLKANGDGIYFFAKGVGGLVLDNILFGIQITTHSIGRVPDGTDNWKLTVPSPSAANTAATLGSPSALRVNEWLADESSGDDWFELFNGDTLPVALGGLYLTDTDTIRNQYLIPALSYIGTGQDGFTRFWAANTPDQGANHTNFKLSPAGEAIGIYNRVGVQIDLVKFGQQTKDVSQGRLPDGTANIVFFSGTTSPGEPNYLAFPGLIVNELLSHTDPPLEDAVEFLNTTAAPIDIGGWYLSNKKSELKRYKVPAGTIVPAQGFKVFYEKDFNFSNPVSPFNFNSAHGDEVYLAQADVDGRLTGYRVSEIFESAENGVSFGRYNTSVSGDYKFVAMSRRSFGADNPANQEEFRTGTGRPNPAPRVGPIVINEIMFHPKSAVVTDDNILDEYIELKNITSSSVPLYDPLHPENKWRLQNGLKFDFPGTPSIPPFGYALLVSFNPAVDTAQLASFKSKFTVPAGVQIFGPWVGKIANSGDSLELYKPDPPQLPPHPDAGYVPYIRGDKVNFSDVAPWPSGADGTGLSLQRKNANIFGNDPKNWQTANPTAGAGNSADVVDSDGDGMPDVWELANGFNPFDPSDASRDSDRDGFTNLQEYAAGTDPRSSASRLRIESFTPAVGTIPAKLQFVAVAGKSYSVQVRNDFSIVNGLPADPWHKLVDVDPQAQTGTFEVSDPKSPTHTERYYRVVTPAAD